MTGRHGGPADTGRVSVTWLAGPEEERGVRLAQSSITRLHRCGLDVGRPAESPEGPHFRYDTGPGLFLGRSGRGPLTVAWDTNLLLDYFEHGARMWAGASLPDGVPAEHGAELEALQLLISLWVLRDIRFVIPPAVVGDSRRKPLPVRRRARRMGAWREFESALALVAAPEVPAAPARTRLASGALQAVLRPVPAGNDRGLVEYALTHDAHVFLTRDKGVLAARQALAPFGLLLASPADLLEELSACGALHCLFAPRHLYWPMPDQQRVTHLIRALDPDDESELAP